MIRTSPEPMLPSSARRTVEVPPPPAATVILLVVPEHDREKIHMPDGRWRFVSSTATAIRVIQQQPPRLIVVDADDESIDALEVCRVGRANPATSIMVLTAATAKAPVAIKAGADAILLKPFPPNLLSARIGRTVRETRTGAFAAYGPTRPWPGIACPTCGTHNAVSFDFSSHRRMWLACLSCDHTWLGPRLE